MNPKSKFSVTQTAAKRFGTSRLKLGCCFVAGLSANAARGGIRSAEENVKTYKERLSRGLASLIPIEGS